MSDRKMVVCGRPYRVTAELKGVRPRVIVEGVNHPKGEPIRFKSVDRAERHIRNMRLVRQEEAA